MTELLVDTQSTPARGGTAFRTILGPWPLHPYITWMAIFAFNFYALNTSADIGRGTMIRAWEQVGPACILIAAVALAVIGSACWLLRLRGRLVPSRLFYLTSIVIAGAAAGAATYLVRFEFDSNAMSWRGFAYYMVRTAIILVFVHNLLGTTQARLLAQVERTEHALEEVSKQRRAIIEAEERARSSVASFLHDRVQAGLVSIALAVADIRRRATAPTDTELTSVIAALEEMRSVDVREASRQLSPNLDSKHLVDALRELAGVYAPALEVRIDVTAAPEDWARVTAERASSKLAAYRVVEQALLNSATHGHATGVDVVIARIDAGIEIRVEDNGEGFVAMRTAPGRGSTLIDAWIGALGGTWRLASVPGEGACLTARIPFAD